MFEIRTEVEIDATPECVWDVLLDFRAYQSWNPFLRYVGGGARLHQSERFRGIFARLLRRTLERDTRRGFTEMNGELKRLAEGKGRTLS